MSESRSPADSLVDLFVYLPLGAALAAREMAREMAPELSLKGRRLVQDRLTSARLIGELTVKNLERMGGGLLGSGSTSRGSDRATEEASPAPRDSPALRPRPAGSPGSGAAAAAASPAAPAAAAAVPAEPATGDNPNPTPDAGPTPDALAIPGYDTLSAFQVVQRLEGLSPAELDAVRAHEQAGRKRQTVLNRIAQLSAAS